MTKKTAARTGTKRRMFKMTGFVNTDGRTDEAVLMTRLKRQGKKIKKNALAFYEFGQRVVRGA